MWVNKNELLIGGTNADLQFNLIQGVVRVMYMKRHVDYNRVIYAMIHCI